MKRLSFKFGLLPGFIFLVFINFNSCSSSTAKKDSLPAVKNVPVTSNDKGEDFDTFFKKFKLDSVFQVSRIKFPLKLTISSDDGDTTRFIPKSSWKYISFTASKKEKGIIKKIHVKADEVNVQYTIEDSGIEVEHFFFNVNGKWWLTFAKDESD